MTAFSAKTRQVRVAVGPSLARHALAIGLAIAIFAGLTSAASASCGDWLADSSHSMAAKEQAKSSSTTVPARTAKLPAPCDGPLCRKAPTAPSSPTPVTITIRVEKLSIAAQVAADAGSARQFGLSPESDARPVKGFLPSAWHPPRV
jgi:hypothetical protein